MKETVEHNNRFYTNEKGEIKTENEQLKEWLIIANKENERLNNIINEFDKWLLGEKMMFYKGSDNERLIRFNEATGKWLELKGSDKE